MRDDLHKVFGDDFFCIVATIVGYMMHLQNLWHIYIDVDACYNWPVDSFVFMQFSAFTVVFSDHFGLSVEIVEKADIKCITLMV